MSLVFFADAQTDFAIFGVIADFVYFDCRFLDNQSSLIAIIVAPVVFVIATFCGFEDADRFAGEARFVDF